MKYLEIMIDIIEYIRNLIFPSDVNRKKRRSIFEQGEVPVKIRRTMSQHPHLEDNWNSFSSSSSGNFRSRSNLYSSSPPLPINKSKENIVYNIDDDDVLLIKNNTKFNNNNPIQITSTPNVSTGDDDVAIVSSESLADKKTNFRKQGLDYINLSCFNETQNTFRQPTSKLRRAGFNSTTPTIFSSIQEVRSKLNSRNPSIHSSTLDQSFRLDEKLRYRELLSRAAPSWSSYNTNGSLSNYSTPTGKLCVDTRSRGKKLVGLAQRTESKETAFIDLTDDTSKKYKPRPSIKDTINKVLDDFDNEPVVVKDSDSEVEILPSPPSPKPDFKVGPVNSLKAVIDTSEHSHKEWVDKLIKERYDQLAKKEKEIQKQRAQVEKFSQINHEIRIKLLEEDVKRSLQIKDIVLPVEVSEEASLPQLTEEQEKIVANALNPRGNPNEVLAQKFSLSITRRDLLTLSGLNWLNDEVINFYMNLIIERGKLPQWPKAYAMNTFFYPKLLKDGPASLRRWTRKVDIFAHDIIAVPIHLGVHWCMSMIDFRYKTIKYYDSMGGSNRRCLDALLNYLQAEHMDKKKTKYDVSNWELESVKDIPQQMNGSDCGMFSCTFAEFLTRDAKITFSQEDMPYLRRKMVLEIITGVLLIT
ncbi:ubiquitin-like-specific protease ESD4 [Agrilus planipennis]|uniref:Ubiquitin-like-specific protease ESD4 n=1 Tax=Agrilus planipennis TaxID=224129 RepID=A0A1W4WJW7_AGRPL|nr:ubiquitin-like-specific protease ESD4 [Agrilus planipennis]